MVLSGCQLETLPVSQHSPSPPKTILIKMVLSLSAIPTMMMIVHQILTEYKIMYMISFDPHHNPVKQILFFLFYG